MPYKFFAESIHIKKLCSRFSSRKVHFKIENGHFAFLNPLGSLGAMYVVRLWLMRKCIIDFLLVIIEMTWNTINMAITM